MDGMNGITLVSQAVWKCKSVSLELTVLSTNLGT